jgi:hypothetical protein
MWLPRELTFSDLVDDAQRASLMIAADPPRSRNSGGYVCCEDDREAEQPWQLNERSQRKRHDLRGAPSGTDDKTDGY